MKVVDTREYVGMLKELTEEGKELSMLVFGSSMAPFLIHARDMIYFKKPDRELQKGDIVFFRRKSGQEGVNQYHVWFVPEVAEMLDQDTVYLAAFSLEKQAIKDHSMILHSAYMCYEDTAVLFSAPSETGKSTQAGLWEKYRGTWTVNGDRSLLIREEDGWYANGWPVCGSSEICNNKSYPVRAIVMLSQAKENRISRLKGLEALRKVMEQITINAWNSEFQIQAMDELEILLKEVPVYHLECDISEDAVRCLEDVLADGRGEE